MARAPKADAPAPVIRQPLPPAVVEVAAGVAYEAARQLRVSQGDRTRQPWEFTLPSVRDAAIQRVKLIEVLPDHEPTDFEVGLYKAITDFFAKPE